MNTLSRLLDSLWTKEFVETELAKLTALLTFGLLLLFGVLNLDLLTRLTVVVGWFILTPLFAFLGPKIADAMFEGDDTASQHGSDPLDILRDRYARGEITEGEFERRLEQLLETEDESVSAVHSGTADDGGVHRSRRDREPVYE